MHELVRHSQRSQQVTKNQLYTAFAHHVLATGSFVSLRNVTEMLGPMRPLGAPYVLPHCHVMQLITMLCVWELHLPPLQRSLVYGPISDTL